MHPIFIFIFIFIFSSLIDSAFHSIIFFLYSTWKKVEMIASGLIFISYFDFIAAAGVFVVSFVLFFFLCIRYGASIE